MIRNGGYKIVLSADRTLMSENGGGVFLGFSACVPNKLMPENAYFSLFCPSVDVNEEGSAKYAPCGTRKIEAALLRYGFKREDIIVAHPDHLDKVVGPETRVVGVTENDTLGIGPATSTFTQLFGGEAYMAIKFRELLANPSIRRFRPRVVVGGAEAWQLDDGEVRSKMGIDTVVIGEGEEVIGPLFERAINGEDMPPVVYGEVVPEKDIPLIVGPTIHGIVEIARGCGRGCAFCVPTMLRYRCRSVDSILKEVEVNLKSNRQPLLHAEDVLRYGAMGLEVKEEAVVGLFKAVMSHPGVRGVGISHFSLSSAMSAPKVVEEMTNIMGVGERFPWLNGQTGIETGSPRMVEKHMAGKCRPFQPEDWPDVVVNAFELLSENHWVPCGTLILGLPGETEEDVNQTIELIKALRGFKSLIVPLFFVSTGGLMDKVESFTVERMTPRYSELFLGCWEHNFYWMPKMIGDYTRMSFRSSYHKYWLRLLTSYGIRNANKLFQACRADYGYDLQRMINDMKSGKMKAPAMVRFTQRVLRRFWA